VTCVIIYAHVNRRFYLLTYLGLQRENSKCNNGSCSSVENSAYFHTTGYMLNGQILTIRTTHQALLPNPSSSTHGWWLKLIHPSICGFGNTHTHTHSVIYVVYWHASLMCHPISQTPTVWLTLFLFNSVEGNRSRCTLMLLGHRIANFHRLSNFDDVSTFFIWRGQRIFKLDDVMNICCWNVLPVD